MIDLETIRREVTAVAERNQADKAILFGSYARGTATFDSDIDLIFVEETELPFLARLSRYLDPLADHLNTGVETLVYTREELERIAHRPFVQQALREGIVLYESGKE